MAEIWGENWNGGGLEKLGPPPPASRTRDPGTANRIGIPDPKNPPAWRIEATSPDPLQSCLKYMRSRPPENYPLPHLQCHEWRQKDGRSTAFQKIWGCTALQLGEVQNAESECKSMVAARQPRTIWDCAALKLWVGKNAEMKAEGWPLHSILKSFEPAQPNSCE